MTTDLVSFNPLRNHPARAASGSPHVFDTDVGGSSVELKTIELFFKILHTNGAGTNQYLLLCESVDGLANRPFRIYVTFWSTIRLRHERILFNYWESDGTYRTRATSAWQIFNGEWYHVVLRFNPDDNLFYTIAGSPGSGIATYQGDSWSPNSPAVTSFSPIFRAAGPSGNVSIGSDQSPGINDTVQGPLCEYRFWANTRTEEELNEYSTKFINAPTESGMLHYFRLNDSSGVWIDEDLGQTDDTMTMYYRPDSASFGPNAIGWNDHAFSGFPQDPVGGAAFNSLFLFS